MMMRSYASSQLGLRLRLPFHIQCKPMSRFLDVCTSVVSVYIQTTTIETIQTDVYSLRHVLFGDRVNGSVRDDTC